MAKSTDMTNPAIVLETLKDGNDYCPKLIGRSINAIVGAGKKLDARIHATACAILSRANEHNDGSRINCLVNAMPKSARRKALVAWFHHYSNFRLVEGKDGLFPPAKMIGKDSKMFRAELPLGSFENPFWSVPEKDTDPKAFDSKAFAHAVAALIKRAQAETASLDDAGKDALADLLVIKTKLVPVEA